TSNAVSCASVNNVDVPAVELDQVTVDTSNFPMLADNCVATIKRSKMFSRGGHSQLLANTNARVTIDRTLFDGGDGIDALNGATIHMINSVIANQTGANGAFVGNGGVVIVSFSTVINSTINSGNGTPVCIGANPDGVCFDDSVILNARTGAPPNTIAGTKCTASFSIVFPQGTAISGSNNKIGVNPQLKDPSNSDYHLVLGSPAVDAANTTVVDAIDFEGLARPQGLRNDIGAFEFKP
ncbi:MAG: hypothetical protein JWO36_7157, partial [Myxococcales bacterium]|nr:hypothetical protein [Myxococcales bacterium]